MPDDPKGYYSDLGVSPAASTEDIKAIYRALAKIYHPDVNRDRAAAEKFRRVTAAYEVLSEPAKRRAYDGQPAAAPPPRPAAPEPPPPPPPPRETLSPVHCSVCGRVTAQPRFVVFSQVVSLILVTRATPKGGICCSDCASRVGFRASAMSAVFGWWGFPWGPIHTVGAILGNAFGGKRRPEVEEELLWHNALAFLDQGQPALSASLAARLTRAKNPAIAKGAKELSDHLAADGVEAERLRSPRFVKLPSAFAQLALGAVVPGLATFLILGTAGGNGYGAPSASPGRPAYSAGSPATARDLCAVHPRNGGILFDGLPYVRPGHRLTIRNGSAGDAIVKMRDAATGRTVVSFFAERNMTAVLDNLPDGEYRLQFAYGDAMAADCLHFLNAAASEFPGVQSLATRRTASQILTQQLSFTLYTVPGGNVRPSGISTAAFDAD